MLGKEKNAAIHHTCSRGRQTAHLTTFSFPLSTHPALFGRVLVSTMLELEVETLTMEANEDREEEEKRRFITLVAGVGRDSSSNYVHGVLHFPLPILLG